MNSPSPSGLSPVDAARSAVAGAAAEFPVPEAGPAAFAIPAPGQDRAGSPRNHIRPLDAIRALRALARSGGTDSREAAAFMSATEGRSGQRGFARFQASASGAALLHARPSLRAAVGEGLAALPAGTLGRAYHDFMAAHGFSVEGMAELGLAGGTRPMSRDERWFTERMNTLHDVRHVVAGYGQEPLGELCLLAFRYAQTGHPGMAFFAVVWGLKIARAQRGQPVVAAVLEGYRRGRRAVWMDDLDWEEMLHQPLAEIRARLGLAPPSVYDRISAAGLAG